MGKGLPGAADGSGESLGQGGLRVGRHFVIPAEELRWRFSGSGGPGGQHANTANTRVDLTFDVTRSDVLGPRQRARLLEHLGQIVRVVASDERSQARNRELALQRLAARLSEALRQDRPRLPTRPTQASRQRRRRDKEARSALKLERRPPIGET